MNRQVAADFVKKQAEISARRSSSKGNFSLNSSEALKLVLEEDQCRPTRAPKSDEVYEVHEARMGIWPPPELKELRLSRPPDQSCRQSNSKQSRDHAVSQSRDRDLFKTSPMFSNSEKIAQSYSFNKLMWQVQATPWRHPPVQYTESSSFLCSISLILPIRPCNFYIFCVYVCVLVSLSETLHVNCFILETGSSVYFYGLEAKSVCLSCFGLIFCICQKYSWKVIFDIVVFQCVGYKLRRDVGKFCWGLPTQYKN